MRKKTFKNGIFIIEDSITALKRLPDNCIDMLLVDLPYGTTSCSWDSIIPFDELWAQYNRVCKKNAAMVFTASQPFTTKLINSNISNFRLEMIWEKDKPSNFAIANKMPMKYHENIIIFYRRQPCYNKQMENRQGSGLARSKYMVNNSKQKSDHLTLTDNPKQMTTQRNPSSVQKFSTGLRSNGIHPTQKPVALFEYLIKTYSNEGDRILDNTAGSGTTAIASINTNRKWVCIENNYDYAAKAIKRILHHQKFKSEPKPDKKRAIYVKTLFN